MEDLKAIKEMKMDHFNLGNDPHCNGPQHFVTISSECYYPKNEGRQILNKERRDDLRNSHFTLGTENEKIYTSNQIDYHPLSINREKQILSDNALRASHFELGPDKRNMITEFMDSYRDTRSKSIKK